MRSSSRNVILAAALSAALGLSIRAAEPAAPGAPAAPAAPATTQPALPAVATINGTVITTAEFDRELQGVQMQVSRRLPPEQIAQLMPQLRVQAISNLVNKRLLLQAAAERKIAISDAEMKTAIDELSKNIPPGQTLEQALKGAGISQKEFMQQMSENLIIEKIIAEEVKKSAVTDADIAKYYASHPEQFKKGESVSARHILVMFASTDDDAKKAEKKKKAEAIRERLLKGEDFVKLCAENSDDPGSKDKGGLYEDFPRGQMVPAFDNAAFTQKVGEIGPIVETNFGYHIIKVEKHTDGAAVPLAEVKDRLKAHLEGQKKQEIVMAYLKVLQDGAKITYAEGYAPPTPAAPHTAPATAPSTAPATTPTPAK